MLKLPMRPLSPGIRHRKPCPISGGLPAIFGNMKNLIGTIPPEVIGLPSLSLSVAHSGNRLSGPLPSEIGNLKFLQELLVFDNQLTGDIPSRIAIEHMDLSHNNLSGHIPKEFVEFVFLVKLNLSFNDLEGEVPSGELQKATNGFCPENLIGVGGFGSVHKGVLEPHQLSLAVKVLNLERRGASKSFMAECETLRNIRHRNLVKIITACSSIDFQVTDVASALDYLHNHNELPIIRCDLKPSNILLDQDMTTHVGDYGLSRIIANDNVQTSQNDISSSVGIRGTIGYGAPEYGMGSKVSTEGDVYSFGILLLEILTAKNPTDKSLEGLSLHQFVKMAFPQRMMEIVDQSLLSEGEEEASCSHTKALTRSGKVHETLISIFTIGLKCSEELPRNRMKINDAFKDLRNVKDSFSKM
ncbi:putative LRR receptor-like serine/threonine-protein kinase [Morus notabilis]|uniref:non-specific serine/threonine protein kinase n=1 Tax=Morus notabilis TaxID=981085 RepID=W9QK30_9ROSA|nr:putative LRR receptor-like serine/threonine-protein kinase [Morus notabilis]